MAHLRRHALLGGLLAGYRVPEALSLFAGRPVPAGGGSERLPPCFSMFQGLPSSACMPAHAACHLEGRVGLEQAGAQCAGACRAVLLDLRELGRRYPGFVVPRVVGRYRPQRLWHAVRRARDDPGVALVGLRNSRKPFANSCSTDPGRLATGLPAARPA